jgi:hypothetical protein
LVQLLLYQTLLGWVMPGYVVQVCSGHTVLEEQLEGAQQGGVTEDARQMSSRLKCV